MRAVAELSITPGQRFQTGVIATLARDGELVTVHETGSSSDAAQAIARRCDQDGYLVRALSSPAMVYRDLHGNREQRKPGPELFGAAGESAATIVFPEAHLLARIGRLDLLERQRSEAAERRRPDSDA